MKLKGRLFVLFVFFSGFIYQCELMDHKNDDGFEGEDKIHFLPDSAIYYHDGIAMARKFFYNKNQNITRVEHFFPPGKLICIDEMQYTPDHKLSQRQQTLLKNNTSEIYSTLIFEFGAVDTLVISSGVEAYFMKQYFGKESEENLAPYYWKYTYGIISYVSRPDLKTIDRRYSYKKNSITGEYEMENSYVHYPHDSRCINDHCSYFYRGSVSASLENNKVTTSISWEYDTCCNVYQTMWSYFDFYDPGMPYYTMMNARFLSDPNAKVITTYENGFTTKRDTIYYKYNKYKYPEKIYNETDFIFIYYKEAV